jgi:hypothetical protein
MEPEQDSPKDIKRFKKPERDSLTCAEALVNFFGENAPFMGLDGLL